MVWTYSVALRSDFYFGIQMKPHWFPPCLQTCDYNKLCLVLHVFRRGGRESELVQNMFLFSSGKWFQTTFKYLLAANCLTPNLLPGRRGGGEAGRSYKLPVKSKWTSKEHWAGSPEERDYFSLSLYPCSSCFTPVSSPPLPLWSIFCYPCFCARYWW